MRLFNENGVPLESTMALTQSMFKHAGELMAMSILQGGPAPNFLSPVFYDIISSGLAETKVHVDMVKDNIMKDVALKVTTVQ